MINRHVKGRVAMRTVYKAFQAVWGGAWSTRGLGIPGSDIISPPDFEFGIEVKDNSQIQFMHFWHPTTLLIQFWEQTKQQLEPGKKPLLACKVEGKWFVVFKFGGIVTHVYPLFLGHINGDHVAVCLMDDFLKELGKHKGEQAA